MGRVFWVRFGDGEDLKTGIEQLAEKENIASGLVIVLGALREADFVVGPKEPVLPPKPVWRTATSGREILGAGTIAAGPDGRPSLHLHASSGRSDEPVITGCLRRGGNVYLLAETVIIETVGINARRLPDPESALDLLTFL